MPHNLPSLHSLVPAYDGYASLWLPRDMGWLTHVENAKSLSSMVSMFLDPWGDSSYPYWAGLVGQTPRVRMWQAQDQ